jgi:hypothetical protein
MRGLENSVILVGRAPQSMWMTDFSDLSMWMTNFSDLSTWMTEFSVTLMLYSCVTLGFCNSVLTLTTVAGFANLILLIRFYCKAFLSHSIQNIVSYVLYKF